MKKLFTGNKDIDFIILWKLSDVDVCNVSLIGRYAREICNSEIYWYGRIRDKFPWFLLQKPENYLNYKSYYIHLVKTVLQLLKSLNWSQGSVTPADRLMSVFPVDQAFGDRIKKEPNQNTLENLSKEEKNWCLRHTAENGDLDMVKYLLENGVDIHVRWDYSLRYASKKGHLEVVKYLIGNGANIHANNDAPLIYASKSGHLEVVKYLVQNCDYDSSAKSRALMFANNREVAEYLLENGAEHYY